jgi:hypothetical protein
MKTPRNKKEKIDALFEMAFLYGEQDRRSFAEAIHNSDPEDADYWEGVANQMRDYRHRRWGKTNREIMLERCTVVTIDELRANKVKPKD